MCDGDEPVHPILLLNSNNPDPSIKEELRLFGQFVGDWDIVEDKLLKDGKWIAYSGELHWGWILDGKAVQDVWIFNGENDSYKGTTVRFYDASIDAWHSIWLSPAKGIVRNFIGRKEGDEIVLELLNPGDSRIQWVFYDICRDTFKWQSRESGNGGKEWIITEKMIIKRQK